MQDNFINIPFTVSNLDRYIIRKAILKALNSSIVAFNGKLLDIGCGKMPYRDYISSKSNIQEYAGLDIESALEYDELVRPDYTWDGINMPFEDNSFNCAIGTEVLEHCPEPEVVLKETWRVLKPDGLFFFTVPFLWNLHEVPHDEYRYTPYSLERHLRNSGFTNIDIKPTGGWHLAMAQMVGLWARRAPMPRFIRPVISLVSMLVMFVLMRISRHEKANFMDGQMITGLYGIARKN
jgi:SAM-dependent methyltransferase